MSEATGPAGSKKTRDFYERTGWRIRNGRAVDTDLFGDKEVGPIRRELDEVREGRIRSALRADDGPIDAIECGCGGNPTATLLGICSHYTGVDFSEVGLGLAHEQLEAGDVPFELVHADACDLPFPDGRFDAAYSAHMIYHIDNSQGQAQDRALGEMLRVVRPGGSIVLITANPFPLLFPVRLFRRLVATTPVLGPAADRLRKAPPLPYYPRRLSWVRRVVAGAGSVEYISHALPSTAFNQRVTEHRGLGRVLWKIVRYLDVSHPRLATYLGNYAQITIRKHPDAPGVPEGDGARKATPETS